MIPKFSKKDKKRYDDKKFVAKPLFFILEDILNIINIFEHIF
jgi:hypothetical protein